MSFQKFIPAVLLVLLSMVSFAADNTTWHNVGDVTAVTPFVHGVDLRAQDGSVRITALSPQVIRVQYSQDAAIHAIPSFAVVPDTGFIAPQVHVTDTARQVVMDTGALLVRVDKQPLRVTFADHIGKVILADQPGSPVSWHGTEFRIWKSMPADEHFFGLGDKAGSIDHRNQAYTLWNSDWGGFQRGTDPLYKAIPFFIGMQGSSAYGVFMDDTYWSSFDFGKERRDAFSFGAENGNPNYYFFYGPEPKAVIGEYTQLTGHTPLPPRFMLGYQQCRWTYSPETRVLELARKFRHDKIPADVIWLDIGYQKGNAPFTIDRSKFPHFEAMVHDLASQGFKMIVITDLHIKKQPGYKPYDEGIAGNDFVHNPDGSVFVGKVWPGDSVFPDFTLATVRQWWGSLYKDFIAMGIRGFWNDMNEPSVFNAEKTMPLDVVHRLDNGTTATHAEIHNVYGMENARATYQGELALAPNLRPVVMTRAGYAGTQRYAATWTGDNNSTWDQMQLSVPMLLSLGVSGMALAGDDIGGFGGNHSPDMLTRWIELGAFNTLYRNHSSIGTTNQEPWVDGPVQEAIRRRFIDARYELLPYIYTAMEENTRDGVPVMRPMFMEFPQDTRLAASNSEYMFGPDLLVAPKMSEMPGPYDVQLPQGGWYDYWTGKKIGARDSISVEPKLDQMPVFARAGSIIPHQPLVQQADQKPQGPLELRVYPGSAGEKCGGSLYDDDGNSFAYKHGVYYRAQFSCFIHPDGITVTLEKAEGSYDPWWSQAKVIIFAAKSRPKHVLVNGVSTGAWQFDAANSAISATFPYRTSQTTLRIQY